MPEQYPLGVILLVDDDVHITELLRYNLGSEGFGVKIIPQASDVNPKMITDVRLIIADAMRQPFTGIDMDLMLKSDPLTAHIPIILCTEADGEDVILRAFDAGVDDYLVKPFSLRELIARVKAVLRRHPRKAEPTHSSGLNVKKIDLSVDIENQRVVAAGETIPLTKTEYAILLFLLKNQNCFFSRTEICKEIWKDEATVNARIVDTNISRLRKKLGDAGRYIINRYGMGYAFVENPS